MATSQNASKGFFTSVARMFQPAPATPMSQNNPGADPSLVPEAGKSKTVSDTPANPLDAFNTLWQTDPKAKPAVDPLAQPLLNTDQKAIQDAAAKMDFVSQLDPALVQKAMSGQDPAAFIQVMNSVAQRTMASAAQLTTATVEQATSKNNQRIQQVLPGKIKEANIAATVPENPALAHPATQPLLQLVRSQLQMKHPEMSAQQITAEAERTLSTFASQIVVPPAAEVKATQQTAGTDWDTWVSS